MASLKTKEEFPPVILKELDGLEHDVSGFFIKTGDRIAKIHELGVEHHSDMLELGAEVKKRMVKAGYSLRGARKALPDDMKHIEKRKTDKPDKNNVTEKYEEQSASSEAQQSVNHLCANCEQEILEEEYGVYQVKPEEYDSNDLPKYNKQLLIDIIRSYEKTHDEYAQNAIQTIKERDNEIQRLKAEIERLRK